MDELWLSPISTWEILVLARKGRIRLKREVGDWVSCATAPFLEAPLTHEITLTADKLSLLQRDPADRFLAATAKVLGLTFVAASETGVKAEMVVKPELCTRPDILHGGAVMAFADTLGAAATVLNLPEGKGTTTIESKTNFVGPAPVGATVIGETTPIHRGRRTMVWQTRITTAEGKLVAVVTQTQMVL